MRDATPIPFGKYELIERLGAGGMAIVYRARYTAAPGITKSVVIKRVLGHYAEDPAFVEMFVNEARISVGLNHGNIVQVFDFGQVNGEYFLAMELVEGQPLSRLLDKVETLGLMQLPAPLAVNIAIEMCKGLHHAHTRTDEKGRPLGLVHRDISPDNVLISYEGEVKISDFGIAKAQLAGRPITASGVVKGKYLYLSPEQACAEPDLDARSDVYTVGVLLYRMLCGRLPVEGAELSVMHRIVAGQRTSARELNPELDDELLQILEEALATDRQARTPNMEALHLQLSHWTAVRAPLFPVHTLKHLMGLAYEAELTAKGRPPHLPPKFRDQVATWSRAQQRLPLKSDSAPSTLPAPEGRARADKRAPKPGAQTTRVKRRAFPPVPRTDPQAPAMEESAQDETVEMAPSMAPTRPEVPATEGSSTSAFGGFLLAVAPHWRWIAGGVLLAFFGIRMGLAIFMPEPSLLILSDPPGARVNFDRMFKGTTPLKLEKISRDQPHTVELTRPGMKSWSSSFEAGTMEEKLEVTLEPLPPTSQRPSAQARATEDSSVGRFGTEKTPARILLQEQWHSFSPTARSFREPLDPRRTYTVWISGSYTGVAPISEQDLRQGLTPGALRSSQLYVFLEGELAPAEGRLFMLSSKVRTVSDAQALHAFVLVGTGSERTVDQELTLHVRDNTSKKVIRRRLDSRRFAHSLAPENRFSVRQLDPELSYTLELRARPAAPVSTVAVLTVPRPGEQVRVSGQAGEELHHALPPGRYTLQGARELWLALPRWEKDGAVELEVSLSADKREAGDN